MPNVVEVLITGKNLTGPALAEAESGALSFGKVMSAIGTIGVAAVAGIAVESARMATTFDSSMTMINTQAGVSKDQIGALSQGVLDLAGKVGFSPDNLADALYHIESSFASIGIKGPQALNLLKISAEGAAVGHANLVDVTNALDAVIASGIGGVKNYSQAMGVLNATVGSGDMKMQDLADAFGTGLLASVKGFGVGITDVGAALAVFGDNNIRGAKAGTDLRMAIQALAAPTRAGQSIFQSWGMTQNQLADDMRTHGLLYALQDLQNEMRKNGVSADEQGQIITEAFGKKAGVGLAVLMGQMDRLKSKYPDLTKAANDFGGAVATNNQTAAQKLKDLQASFDALMIEIGNKVLPVVTEFISFLQGHFTLIATIVGAVLALAAAFKILSLAAALMNTVLDANPFVLIGVAVIALAAVVIKYHTQIWDFIQKTWNDIKNFVIKIWDDILSFAEQWWPLIFGVSGLIYKYHQQIWAYIQQIWNDILGFFKSVWGSIEDVFKAAVNAVTSALSTAWNAVTGAIKTAWGAITSFFTSWWNAEVASFRTMGSTIASVLSAAWSSVTGALKTAWNSIASFFSTWWGAEVSSFRNMASTIEGALSAAWNAMSSAIKSTWGSIASFFSGIARAIEGYFSGAGSWLISAGRDVITGFLNGLKAIWNDVTSFISGIANWIVSHKGPIGLDQNLLVNNGKAIMSGFYNGLKSKYADVTKFVSSVAGDIAGAFTGGPSQAGTGAFGGSVEQMMVQMAAAKGWTGAQLQALLQVENREAGFNPNAQNPSSGAYGLAQFINGPSEYAQYGGNSGTVAGQITGMLNYIAQRYGTPAAAWEHELGYGWYANGGPTSAGWAMVGEHGRELVKLPGGANVYPAGATGQMLGQLSSGQVAITLELGDSFKQAGLTAQQLEDIRYTVRTKGGRGSDAVQKAFGQS